MVEERNGRLWECECEFYKVDTQPNFEEDRATHTI